MATAAAAVFATRLAYDDIEDELSRPCPGDEWLCRPPTPPGCGSALPNESDQPPKALPSWSEDAESVLLTEVEGQRARGGIHWGRAAKVVGRATGYVLTAREARERYEASDRVAPSLLGAARSRPFWRRRLRTPVVATAVDDDDKKALGGGSSKKRT